MTERDKIYLKILEFGLEGLAKAAERDDMEYIKAECRHLHNIPKLIGGPDQRLHDFYFEIEREEYLNSVTPGQPYVDFVLSRYEELWPHL